MKAKTIPTVHTYQVARYQVESTTSKRTGEPVLIDVWSPLPVSQVRGKIEDETLLCTIAVSGPAQLVDVETSIMDTWEKVQAAVASNDDEADEPREEEPKNTGKISKKKEERSGTTGN